MEPFQHTHHSSRKKNTAKVNVTLSVIFHAILVVAGGLWAAHEGMLGDKLKTLTASILDKEKKAEVKKEEPKQEEVKKVDPAKIQEVVKATAPPPPAFVPPAAAGAPPPPPPVILGGGDFGLSQESLNGDPVIHYKQSVETTLRTRWDRPSDIDDSSYVAEVELALDASGHILGHEWKRGSGDKRWDDSVRKVVVATKTLSRPPPKGFPDKFLVRFDVETSKTEPVIQASVR